MEVRALSQRWGSIWVHLRPTALPGLHSDAALRLKSDATHCGQTPEETVKLLHGG